MTYVTGSSYGSKLRICVSGLHQTLFVLHIAKPATILLVLTSANESSCRGWQRVLLSPSPVTSVCYSSIGSFWNNTDTTQADTAWLAFQLPVSIPVHIKCQTLSFKYISCWDAIYSVELLYLYSSSPLLTKSRRVLVCFFHYTTLRIPDKSKTRPSVSLALSSVCALACQYKLGPFPPQSNKLPILESPLISGHLKSSVRPQCLLSTVQLQWRWVPPRGPGLLTDWKGLANTDSRRHNWKS